MPMKIRAAVASDYPTILALYNHYITTSPATFDIEPVTLESRQGWFEQFDETGRHRLLVLDAEGDILGYAASMTLREKAAYDPSVETTIYLRGDATGQGLGQRLYTGLFDLLAKEDIHRAYAAITLPNPASIALHTMLNFTHCGTFNEVGHKLGKYWDVAWYEKKL